MFWQGYPIFYSRLRKTFKKEPIKLQSSEFLLRKKRVLWNCQGLYFWVAGPGSLGRMSWESNVQALTRVHTTCVISGNCRHLAEQWIKFEGTAAERVSALALWVIRIMRQWPCFQLCGLLKDGNDGLNVSTSSQGRWFRLYTLSSCRKVSQVPSKRSCTVQKCSITFNLWSHYAFLLSKYFTSRVQC